MRTTLRDVASEVGVSIKTVSRVVTGDPRVASDTAETVREAVERLGYKPNLAARSLRRGADHTVGLVVDSVADPFFSAVAGAVEDALIEQGYAVLAASTKRDAKREEQIVAWLAQRSVSGCIIVPASADSTVAALGATPTVYLDRAPLGGGLDSVVVEDYAAGKAAVDHLLARGHQRIAFVGDVPEVPTTTARLNGYLDAMSTAGLEAKPEFVRACCPSAAEALVETQDLLSLDPAPTAIFAAGSRQASGVVSGMNDWQRRHIALISFGDLAIADALSPALTVVNHDPVAIARDAVALLLRRINDPKAERQQIVRSLSIVERGSGELSPHDAQASRRRRA